MKKYEMAAEIARMVREDPACLGLERLNMAQTTNLYRALKARLEKEDEA